MNKPLIFWHSRLYYRNTSLVIFTSLAALALALMNSGHWVNLVSLILLIYINYFVWQLYFSIHPRRPIFKEKLPPFAAEMRMEKIGFLSRDGFQLNGWYVPGENHKAIILAHGLGSTALAMVHHARMLQNAGYSVIFPDLRAHGESEGDTITGVFETNDILGALDYLRTRPDVDAREVGALGIAFGARIVLQAARQSNAIRGIVLEGLGPAKLEDYGDQPQTVRRWINYPINLLIYWLFDAMAGVEIPESVTESLRKISPRPVMLISAGRGKERYCMRLFYEKARQPKTLWEIENARHGLAYAHQKNMYAERVIKFFDEALRL